MIHNALVRRDTVYSKQFKKKYDFINLCPPIYIRVCQNGMLHQNVIVWIAKESYLKHDFVVQRTIYASHHTDFLNYFFMKLWLQVGHIRVNLIIRR